MSAVCILLTGCLVYISQLLISTQNVSEELEIHSRQISDDVRHTVTEYPACEWLIRYWYDHAAELDVEYEAGYGKGTSTEEKCNVLLSRHPGLLIRYADEEEVSSLPEEDQKLYAEIVYAWIISDLDHIKDSFDITYLFCVVPDENYENQFFIFSAASAGERRGSEGEQVYPLGLTKSMNERQRDSMKDAEQNRTNFTTVENHVDYYSYLCTCHDKPVFIGMTYSVKRLFSQINARTAKGSAEAMGYQIVLAVIILIGMFLLALKPLRKVQKSIRSYKETKDSAAVTRELGNIRSNNEIGDLAKDVVDLSHKMDEYVEEIEEITAEKEKISTELTLANRIQVSTLPKEFPPFPDRHEFDIYASMDPAREVGGDFYDFMMIDDDHLCLIIADVSGKGIPGALFMMTSKTILDYLAMTENSVSAILESANAALCANNEAEMFVTVWIGILEISTGKMTAANAGHEYPAVKRPDGSYELLKDKHGFVLGGMEGLKFKEYEIEFEPGSCLFLYTDGVPEAADPDNELFGTDRMLEALNSEPDADPEKVLDNVREHVDGFVRDAEQFDDMTMLCFRYNGEVKK